MEQFNSVINEKLSWVHTNKIVFSVITLILAIYFIQARPKLPSYIEKIFENSVFRFFAIALIIYLSNKDLQLAIIISAVFLITMHMINKKAVENLQASCFSCTAIPRPPKPDPVPAGSTSGSGESGSTSGGSTSG